MSKFYGCVRGNRGCATRGGSATSGFKASAQSYDGSVITYLDYDHDNKLRVRIDLADGSSSYGDMKFSGTFEELKDYGSIDNITLKNSDEDIDDMLIKIELKDNKKYDITVDAESVQECEKVY